MMFDNELKKTVSAVPYLLANKLTNGANLVTLADMLEIDNHILTKSISQAASTAAYIKASLSLSAGGSLFRMPKDHWIMCLAALDSLKTETHNLKLDHTHQITMDAMNTIVTVAVNNAFCSSESYQKIVYDLEAIIKTYTHEIKQKTFYMLSRQGHDFLSKKDCLDTSPQTRTLPFAFDHHQAYKCCAFELWTAAVMHMMKVFEGGMILLADYLAIEHKGNWQRTLEKIDTALKNPDHKNHGPDNKAEAFVELTAYLQAIKNAWRNHAMHSGKHYNEREALSIIRAGADFIERLIPVLGIK